MTVTFPVAFGIGVVMFALGWYQGRAGAWRHLKRAAVQEPEILIDWLLEFRKKSMR